VQHFADKYQEMMMNDTISFVPLDWFAQTKGFRFEK
jgi:hypothetical protein